MARVAGVSVATVSRALRGLDRVSPETRERVLRVAEDLHYVASPTATSLASGRTRVVAVVAPFLTRWFFATLVSAIQKTLRAHGHHVMLFDLEDDDFDQRLPLSQNMLWKRVDGVITLNIPMTPDEVALVERLDLPLVAIGTPVQGRACVRIDDGQATRTAMDHLIGLGHERIGYVGAVPANAAHIRTPQSRLAAFRSSLRDAGLPYRDDWVIASDWTADSAARDSRAMLGLDNGPTAVLAASDEMAIGVRESARSMGIDVSGDLSVIGIDDYVLSAVLGLTTVRQDVAGQGHLAAELLLRALVDGEQCSDQVIVPTELVVRKSTGPAPARAALTQ
ncbi:MAG: LacI family DNA-binding transcriptional regulator [Ornithinibacter sp.]